MVPLTLPSIEFNILSSEGIASNSAEVRFTYIDPILLLKSIHSSCSGVEPLRALMEVTFVQLLGTLRLGLSCNSGFEVRCS